MATQLTQAQLLALNNAINGNPLWAAFPKDGDGYYNLAQLLNMPASPAVAAWRRIPTPEVMGALQDVEVDNLFSASKGPALNFLLQWRSGLDCTQQGGPRAVTDILSNANPAAPNSRAAVLAIATEPMTSGQQVFGGTTVASVTPPAATTAMLRNFAKMLTADDVAAARSIGG